MSGRSSYDGWLNESIYCCGKTWCHSTWANLWEEGQSRSWLQSDIMVDFKVDHDNGRGGWCWNIHWYWTKSTLEHVSSTSSLMSGRDKLANLGYSTSWHCTIIVQFDKGNANLDLTNLKTSAKNSMKKKSAPLVPQSLPHLLMRSLSVPITRPFERWRGTSEWHKEIRPWRFTCEKNLVANLMTIVPECQ